MYTKSFLNIKMWNFLEIENKDWQKITQIWEYIIWFTKFSQILDKVEYSGLKENKPIMRMPVEKEKLLVIKFIQYKKKICK